MKAYVLAGLFCAIALPALAETKPQPITLTPEEYQAIVSDIANRDPLIRFMRDKQKQAQDAAEAKAAIQPPSTNAP